MNEEQRKVVAAMSIFELGAVQSLAHATGRLVVAAATAGDDAQITYASLWLASLRTLLGGSAFNVRQMMSIQKELDAIWSQKIKDEIAQRGIDLQTFLTDFTNPTHP